MVADAALHGVGALPRSLPRLVRRHDPFGRHFVFAFQYTLFGGVDLYSTRWRRNGSPLTLRHSMSNIRDALLVLYDAIDELMQAGHILINSCARSEYYERMHSKNIRLEIDNSDNHEDIRAISTTICIHTLSLPDASNITRIVPRTYLPFLNWSLRNVFMRDDKLLDVVFKMEDDGVIFIGDFVQLELARIDLYTRDTKLTKKMVDFVERFDLSTNMTVRGWTRPSTFGIWM